MLPVSLDYPIVIALSVFSKKNKQNHNTKCPGHHQEQRSTQITPIKHELSHKQMEEMTTRTSFFLRQLQ
jgi:hypothetical protein